MKDVKEDIRSIFEAYHYTDTEMIDALEDLKKWCEDSIKNIKEFM